MFELYFIFPLHIHLHHFISSVSTINIEWCVGGWTGEWVGSSRRAKMTNCLYHSAVSHFNRFIHGIPSNPYCCSGRKFGEQKMIEIWEEEKRNKEEKKDIKMRMVRISFMNIEWNITKISGNKCSWMWASERMCGAATWRDVVPKKEQSSGSHTCERRGVRCSNKKQMYKQSYFRQSQVIMWEIKYIL